jgi:uncharacterized membrane protein YgdD (TMEM256/DUF423 family)
MPADRLFLVLAGLLGALGVMLGAFAAHALNQRLTPEAMATFEIGARYHLYHALALLGVAVALGRAPGDGQLALAGWLFVAGIAVFSGSLYVLSLTGQRWLGAVTPLGGLAFIAGWLLLAWSAWRG